MNKLIIIQCVKTKIWQINPESPKLVEAQEAYVSTYFKLMKEYTQQVEHPEQWLIFSAEWGFITPDYKICDYGTTYNLPITNPLPKETMTERIKNQQVNIGSVKPEYEYVNNANKEKIQNINYKDFKEIIFLGGQ